MKGPWSSVCGLCGRLLSTSNVVLVVAIVLLVSPTPTSSQLNLPLNNIRYWSEEFGAIISGVVSRATGEVDIRAEYAMEQAVLEPVNGTKMVAEMKKNMESMLQKKVNALSELVDVAEEAHSEHIEDEDIQSSNFTYPEAKNLNTTEFPLEEDEHFNYIPVNLNKSTVHVPTNVYEHSVEVLNGVKWSEALNTYFQRNYENDPTLTWQYFGSASGFFRNYPGMQWPTPPGSVDLFDCRTRGWYIQAATSPKDIIILLDASGSMKGLRMAIAKATVEKILETLSDDDFFNVIQFSLTPSYVDTCFNNTLVQANTDNKKRVTKALDKIDTADIAKFDDALEEAFSVLKSVNDSGKGARCNRAIMLITDGAPETYEEIFRRYNWPDKSVRVFTYLIGREVGDSRQVVWMACENKGYYSHISTLADVHEHVQEYINVISRPMVIDRANHTIWTSVYVDAAHDTSQFPEPNCENCEIDTGLQLMTSVAAPVYDMRKNKSTDGILLGVMGTDVPLKELTKLTPKYKLGVNGYAFAITNNGYILFHPDFRPTEGPIVKPNYNSVDLAEVEIDYDYQREAIQDLQAAEPHYDMELRRRMIERETGHLAMDVKIHYDDMKRITIRKQDYFFTYIDGTPFSLGIALPEPYGQYRVNGMKKLDENAELDAFTASKIKVANWNYCKMDTNETRQDPALMLRKYMEYGKKGNALYDRCDNEMIESILFDAMATRGALASWIKENRDGTNNDSTSKSTVGNCTEGACLEDHETARNGIELVFLGTKGGLTRYTTFTENLTDPYFIENNTETIEEMYYIQAVEGGDKIFTFSVPFDAAERYPNLVVTASTPIVHIEKEQMAVPMVVGLQMRYEKFYEFFMNSTLLCPEEDKTKCNLTCHKDEIDCYLIDNNGYIVLSEDPSQLGQFFGTNDSELVRNLLYEESNLDASRGVFQQIQIFDYQGICQKWLSSDSGARALFINPIIQFINICWWLISKLSWLLIQFNLFLFWPSSVTASTVSNVGYYNSPEYDDGSDYSPGGGPPYDGSVDTGELCVQEIFNRANKVIPEEIVFRWRNRLITSTDVDYNNCDEVRDWVQQKKEQYRRSRKKEDEPCVKHLRHFLAKGDNLPYYGTSECGMYCTRSYSIHRVVGTNLMLLVVDALCDCEAMADQFKPTEVEYNDSMTCQRLQREIFRKRPLACYASHVNESSKQCGGASFVQPSQITYYSFLVFVAVYFIIMAH